MPRSQIVLADAQFGTERFMRPNEDFIADYDGQGIANPLWLFPDSSPLDQQAGKPGYDPNLIRGLSVPVGARLILKIPNIVYIEGLGPLVVRGYIWSFMWRERNLFDYRTQRIPWHLPQGRGPDDSTVLPPSPRVTLPVSSTTVIYNQPEPVNPIVPDGDRAVQRARSEDIRFSSLTLSGPLLPGGNVGVIQQGVLNPANFSGATRQSFMSHEIQALEDELLIAVYRNTGPANWELTPGGADEQLGELLGNLGDGANGASSKIGVYIKAGSAP